jgi:hypothetical protein
MNHTKEYLSKILHEAKIRHERQEKLDTINTTLEKICNDLDSFTSKITEADGNGTDLSPSDKTRLNELTTAYNAQIEATLKLLTDERLREGEYPVYHKSSANKMILKKLQVDGVTALCSWIDASGIDIEREFSIVELTRKIPI